LKALLSVVAVLAVVAGTAFWFSQRNATEPDNTLTQSSGSTTGSATSAATTQSIDGTATSSDTATPATAQSSAPATTTQQQPLASLSADQTDNTRSDEDALAVIDLGIQALDESEFRYWALRLRDNPLLLQSVLTQYIENRDTPRARNLAALLAEVNSPEVLDAAVQLSQATDVLSQQHGLELLARLQPLNTHARNNAIDLLATQTDPALLVSTLNVFATPAQVVSSEQRQLLLDHAQLLSTHSDASVRAHSISIISKWSKGNTGIAATAGLSDPDEAVRARSAASLIGVSNPSDNTKQALLTVAANRSEPKATRQLALYALSKMPLDDSERTHYHQLEIEVRRTR
jgi:hypothetical protein